MVSDPEGSTQRSGLRERTVQGQTPVGRLHTGGRFCAVGVGATETYMRSHTVRVSKRRNWVSKPAAVAVSVVPSVETT